MGLDQKNHVDVYTYADYRNHATPKGGFVETFFKAFEEKHKSLYEDIVRKYQMEIHNGLTSYNVCKINDEYNKEMRRTIDREIHYYLFEGGEVEAYPYPVIGFDFGVRTTVREYNDIDEDYDKHSYVDSYSIIFDQFGTEWKNEDWQPKPGPRKFQYAPFYCESKYDRILSDKRWLETQIGTLEYEKSKFFLRMGARKEKEQEIRKLQKEYDALAAQYDFEEVEKKAKKHWKEFERCAKQVYQAWYENTNGEHGFYENNGQMTD